MASIEDFKKILETHNKNKRRIQVINIEINNNCTEGQKVFIVNVPPKKKIVKTTSKKRLQAVLKRF
jgi:hypothetical protein